MMKQIRRGTFRNVLQLKTAIREFIDTHQANPKPFVWTKSADEILASIARFASGPWTRGPRNKCHEPWLRDTRWGKFRRVAKRVGCRGTLGAKVMRPSGSRGGRCNREELDICR
jgi:hypothetical protein